MKVISNPRSQVHFHRHVSRPRIYPGETWARLLLLLVLLTWASSFVIGFENAVTVLTILCFGAAVLGLRWPALGMLGIGMMVTLDAPMRHFVAGSGLIPWNSLNYWLFITMLVSIPFLLRLSDPQSRILQAFIILLGLELLISPSKREGILDIINIVSMFGILVYFARAVKDHKVLYPLGLICGVLSGFGGLSFYLLQNRISPINMNAWATFPATALIVICISSSFIENLQRRWFVLFMLAMVNSVWVFLSGSRGNMLITLVCMAYLILKMRSKAWGTISIIMALILGSIILLKFTNQQEFALQRIEKLFDPTYTLSSRTSGRFNIAQVGWQIFKDNPLGVGTGGFRIYFPEYDEPFLTSDGQGTAAHSAWVKTLAENGVPGILLMAAYVLSFTVTGWRKKSRELIQLGIFVSVVLSISFITAEFQGKGLWWLAAGVTVIMHRDKIIRILSSNARQGYMSRRVYRKVIHRG